MPLRQCPRCHTVLPQEQEGTLVFCYNCGAPQVRVSEELLAQSQKQRAALDSGVSAGVLGAPSPEPVAWPLVVRYTALAGLLAAALTMASFALPPVILLAWFWAVGAPIVILGVYSSKARPVRVGARFGARVGLLCGFFIFFSMSAVNAAGLVLARYVFHDSKQIDTQLGAMFTQLRTTVQQQSSPAQASVLAWLGSPEDRIGLILAMSAVVLVLYLALSALGGAFAAVLRSRNEARR